MEIMLFIELGFVYRFSFFVLAILTLGKAKLNDWRTIVQNGFFIVKLLLLIGLMIGSFFIPNNVFNVYANISIFGSSLFIIIQMLILVDFAYWVNEYLVSKSQDDMDNEKKMVRSNSFLSNYMLYFKQYLYNRILCLVFWPRLPFK